MSTKSDNKCWSNGKLLQNHPAMSSINAGMHYPNQVWEGMRAYLQHDGSTKIFLLKEHIERLYKSAKFMGMEVPVKAIDVMQGAMDLVKFKGNGDMYLRPIVYETVSCEGVIPGETSVNVDMYAFPILSGYPSTGVKAVISSIPRGYPMFNMQVKASMNYGNLTLYTQEAARSGAEVVLVPNADGFIMESAVANIFVVKDGIILTPPNNGDILPGLTRKTIIQRILLNPDILYKKYHLVANIVEKNLTKADIYNADEMFLCGTYAEVTPIIQVDGKTIGEGRIGKITHIVKTEYDKIVRSAYADK